MRLSPGRIALACGAVALVAFLPSLGNGWALDDVGVIERNARAHGVGDALRGFFAPYWPRTGNVTAGLYRPLVILTYAVDWTLSGGRPWLAHLSNTLWHAVATGLVVLVAAAWYRGWPLLATGLVFALHPVHVEAVANVVGRAELLAAVFVLAAVLLARRHRAVEGAARARWGAAVVVAVLLGLLVKEHAIVAIPLVALDGALTRRGRRADPAVYLGLVAIVLAWLHVWRAVAGGFVLDTVAAPFRGLGALERTAMMAPVLLDIVRLLVWPFDLAADYNPRLVDPVMTLTVPGLVGLVTVAGLLALALVAWRRAPALAFGIIGGALAWGPTANVLVPSGIVLAERTLYLPSIVVALTGGWLALQAHRLAPDRRRLAAVAALALGVAWVVRVETRIPFWHDTRTVVIEDYLQHSENYRAHARVGSVYEITGDTASALREFLAAAAVWEGDYVLTLQSGRAARALGNRETALAEARRGAALAPHDPAMQEHLALTLSWAGLQNDALAVTRTAIDRFPGVVMLEERHVAVLRAAGAPDWHVALAEARLAWLTARPGLAGGRLADAARGLPETPGSGACWDLRAGAGLARSLMVGSEAPLRRAAETACSGD